MDYLRRRSVKSVTCVSRTASLFRYQCTREALRERAGLDIGAPPFAHIPVLSSVLAPLEALSTFARRNAAGELSESNFSAIMSRISTDRRQWELVELDAPVLGQAEDVLQRTQLRTLDALHVASALIFHSRSSTALPSLRLMKGKDALRNRWGCK